MCSGRQGLNLERREISVPQRPFSDTSISNPQIDLNHLMRNEEVLWKSRTSLSCLAYNHTCDFDKVFSLEKKTVDFTRIHGIRWDASQQIL
jgi:hypothetical protein